MSIIVSQNSTDLVTERVMKELAAEVRVTPRAVAGMPLAKLARILRPAGLSRQKVPKIREIARTLVERRDDDMDGGQRAQAEALGNLPQGFPGETPCRAGPPQEHKPAGEAARVRRVRHPECWSPSFATVGSRSQPALAARAPRTSIEGGPRGGRTSRRLGA